MGETNVADSGSKPDGSGVPAGAEIGGLVVVVVDDVVVVVVVGAVVVVVGDALLFDEIRLTLTVAPTIITSATTTDVITSLFFLVMAFLRKLPYTHLQ